MTPSLTADPGSDVTLAASSEDSDSKADYIKSCENLPMRLVNTPELAGHIRKIQLMHVVTAVDLKELSQQTNIFTHPKKVDPTELANDDTTPAKNQQYNGAIPPHIT